VWWFCFVFLVVVVLLFLLLLLFREGRRWKAAVIRVAGGAWARFNKASARAAR
jgi:hypothetical protein